MKTIEIEDQKTREKMTCYSEKVLPFGMMVRFRHKGIFCVGTVLNSDTKDVTGNDDFVLGLYDTSEIKRLENPKQRFENLLNELVQENKKIEPLYQMASLIGMTKKITDIVCEMISLDSKKMPMAFIRDRARCIPVEHIFPPDMIELIRHPKNPNSGIKVFNTLQDCCRCQKVSYSCIAGIGAEKANWIEKELARFGLSFLPATPKKPKKKKAPVKQITVEQVEAPVEVTQTIDNL